MSSQVIQKAHSRSSSNRPSWSGQCKSRCKIMSAGSDVAKATTKATTHLILSIGQDTLNKSPLQVVPGIMSVPRSKSGFVQAMANKAGRVVFVDLCPIHGSQHCVVEVVGFLGLPPHFYWPSASVESCEMLQCRRSGQMEND